MIRGHTEHLKLLEKDLPLASFFSGPASVGKWTTAEHLRRFYGIDNADVLRVHKPLAADARSVIQFASTPPIKSKHKLVIMDALYAGEQAQNMLLETVENATTTKFIFVGNYLTDGLLSRVQKFYFTYLKWPDLARILVDEFKFEPKVAAEIAPRSGGQVQYALKLAEMDETIETVRSAIRALRARDAAALDEIAVSWSDEATAMMTQWCSETLTGRWRVFSPEDGVQGRGLPLKILRATEPTVRPRLVVRSQLMSVLKAG